MNKKKIFMIIALFIFVMSLSCVSASENDTVLALSETNDISGISNVNASDIDDEIIGNSIESESLLGANKKEAKINLTGYIDGIIEDGIISITATFTTADGTPLAGKTIHPWFDDNQYKSETTDENGQFVFNIAQSSGFYYFKVFFNDENDEYAPCESKMIELAFANDNTLVDLAVRSFFCDDGVLNLTKDYTGYGLDNVTRRDVNNYNNIIYKIRTLHENGIAVNNDLIVNGNGHTIDFAREKEVTSLFSVNNCRLTLNDMALLNAYFQSSYTNLIFCTGDNPTINFYNVSVINSTSITTVSGPTPIIGRGLYSKYIIVNCINSTFIGNDVGSIFPIVLKDSLIEGCMFLDTTCVFFFSGFFDVDIKSNFFLNNSKIFDYSSTAQWERGYVTGNYWGTNDSSVINSIRPSASEIYMSAFRDHSYLTIEGNDTFCEDDIQDYDIYFSGSGAAKLPTYKTVISYTSNNSTINTTDVVLSSNKTTVRVSPKSYGLETLVVEPNLYVLPINITKSIKFNYNVSVDAPETEYSVPLNIIVNVRDVDNNTITTTANVTINEDTHTIDINNGVGTLPLNDLVPGTYNITTKILSHNKTYRNTTLYSSFNIIKATPALSLTCNVTSTIARENVPFTIKSKNSAGNNVSVGVYLVEDGVEVGNTTTDSNGNAVYYYRPEVGNHTYTVITHEDKYWKNSESNKVNVYASDKITTKLTISSDTDFIMDANQKATIITKLSDVNNRPLKGAEIKLIANGIVVDKKITDSNGECEFKYINSSNVYKIKAQYDGNLTYYDNSSETIDLTISTSGNFFDLSILINNTNENAVLKLKRNFTFNESLDGDFVNGIPINKNIVIEGNGNVINGLNKAKIFDIETPTVTLNNLNFVNAYSSSNGGAVFFSGDTLTISNSVFENNTVIKSTFTEDEDYIGGGAVYSMGVLNIINSTFNKNKVILYINFTGSKFYNGGGAVYARDNVNVRNSIFNLNKLENVSVPFLNSSSGLSGSSLFIKGMSGVIYNSTFSNGNSSNAAVYYSNNDNVNSDFTVYDSLFINNSANIGAAMSISAPNKGGIFNTSFINNSARNQAGAVNLHINPNYNFTIKDSKFINNSASNDGGAIFVDTPLIIEKNYFINNKASNGSSIYYVGSGLAIDIRYNIFVNNTADNATGVYVYQNEAETDPMLNYDYWGNNTPYDANVFNEDVKKIYDYITIEIEGQNVTYTTVPTTYIIKFNGTNADKLPNFETLIDALAKSNVNLDKTSIIINGSGAKVVLTSDEAQNITLIVGPEYNILAKFNIAVEKLIKRNYTSNISISGNVYGNTTVATIDIFDENGNKSDINGTLTYTFNNKTANATISNGEAVILLGRNDAGIYDFSFVYNSTNILYNDLTGNKTFEISKANTTFTLDANNITYGDNEIITATPQRGITGNYTFYIKDVLNETVLISRGIASYTLKNLNAGNYIVTATFNNKNYNPVSVSRSFTVSKAASGIEISIADAVYGDEIVAVVTGENITGTATVTVNNKNYTVKLINNAGNVTIDKLDVGKYVASVSFGGNDNILPSLNKTSFEVLKDSLNMSVDISESILGHDTTIEVSFDKDVKGNVKITVDGKEYSAPIKNGVATLTLSDLDEGEHSVNVKYPGDGHYNATEVNTTFTTKSLESQLIVTAKDIVYGQNLTVKATVASNATGKVEFTVGGVTKTADVKKGVAQVTFTGLNAGNYKITAKYSGDGTYISATNTTTAKVSKAKSQVLIEVGEIKDGENVIIKFTVLSDATGNVTVEIPGLYTPRNRTITNGVATWTLTPLKPGTYTLNVKYAGDKNYLSSSNSTVLISKSYPVIKIDVGEAGVGQDAVINVALPSDATGSVLITVDGKKYNKTLKNGKTSLTISNVTKGKHNIDVVYSGNNLYYSTTNSTSFEPKSMNSTINLIASDINFGEDLTVRAVVNNDATGTVTFTVNGKSQTVQIHQGFAAATFENVNAGTYTVKAVYSGDESYLSSSNTTKVKVSKVKSTITISVGKIEEGKNVAIKFIAPDLATGNITVEIPGLYSKRVRELTNGEYTWVISPLSAGLYQIKVTYDGDVNYYGSSNSTYVDYNRVKTTLNVDVEVSKTKLRLNAKLGAEDGQLITAWVNITIGDNKYRIPVFNGTGYLDISRLKPGNYSYYAFYAGTKVLINSSDSGKVEVPEIVTIISAPDVTKYFKGSERFYVYLKDNYNDPIVNATVKIAINNVEYTRTTDKDGSASIALNLDSGEYITKVTHNGTTINAKVTILTTVNGTDLVKVFRNATQYYATFRDSQGNYLKDGTTVRFNIHGVFYDRTVSGGKGLAKLNINIEQGEYIITAINLVTGESRANKITVIPRIIENYDLTKYYRNESQYTVKIIGDDGKAVGAGEEVTFNINGVFYTRTTNASGIAKLNINLQPGDYIITVGYNNCLVSNKIKVLPVLSAKDLTKKYGTSSQFIANLVDGQGKAFSGQTIQFNINGVFYNRQTDSLGQARLNINLQAGKYIITSTYNGASISNTVTVIP